MGDTPIESLIIELKLKADELTDSAAEKALKNIQGAVQGLNKDLKEAEKSLSAIGGKFGGFGSKAVVREKSGEAKEGGAAAPAANAEWNAQSKQLERDAKADELRKKRSADRAHAVNLRRIDQIANKEAREEQRRVAIAAKAAQDVIDEEERAGKRAELLKFKAAQKEIKDRDVGEAAARTAAESLATDLKAIGVDTEARKRGISRETDSGTLTRIRGRLEDELATVGDQIKAGLVDPERGKARQESLAGLIGHTKGLEDTAKREERANAKQRKMPTSLKGMIGGMEGLGPIAAGVYLMKSAIGAIKGLFSTLESMSVASQNVKQLGEQIGLTSEEIEGYRVLAVKAGDTQGAVINDIKKLGTEWASAVPGQFHIGLQRLGVTILDGAGKLRRFKDVLDDTAKKVRERPEKAEEAYRVFSQLGIAGKQLIDIFQIGPEGVANEKQKALDKGTILSNEYTERIARMNRQTALLGMTIDTMFSKLTVNIWDFLFNPWTKGQEERWKKSGWTDASLGKNENVKVTPQSASVYRSDAWNATSGMGKDFKIDQMNVNVRVDKDGRATASVDGVKPSRVTTNVAPWAGAR